MTQFMFLRRFVAISALAVLGLSSCLERTVIIFDITTDIPCGEITATAINVGLEGETEGVPPTEVSENTKVTVNCTADGNVGAIGTLSVSPKVKKDALVSARVVAAVGSDVDLKADCTFENGYKGCVVARRIISYVPGTTLTVPIKLLRACRDVPCDAKSSCNTGGRCITAYLDNTKCDEQRVCTEPLNTDEASTISPSKTEVTLSADSVNAGSSEPVVVTVKLNDEAGMRVASAVENVVVTEAPNTLGMWLGTGFVSTTEPGVYTRSYKVGSKSGSVTFTAKVNQTKITSATPTLKITQTLEKSVLRVPQKIVQTVNTDQTVTLKLLDANDAVVDLSDAEVQGEVAALDGTLTKGTLSNGGRFTYTGGGNYSLTLTSPASVAGCTMDPWCINSVSVTVKHPSINGGMATPAGKAQRVQWGVTSTLGTPPGKLTMTNVGALVGSTNTVSGDVQLFDSTGAPFKVGGVTTLVATVSFAAPPVEIVDNDNGTYTVIVRSPQTASTGTLVVKVGTRDLTNGTQPITFFGAPDATKSELTLSSAILSGPVSVSTVRARLTLKDTAGNPITTPVLTDQQVAFEVTGLARLDGAVTSMGPGAWVYSQQISRPVMPEIDFETVTVSAKIQQNGTWVAAGLPQTLLITPVSLSGVTIDCTNIANYRNQNIYVANGTLTIDSWLNGSQPSTQVGCTGFGPEPFTFKKVVVGPMGVITHSPGTFSVATGLEIVATDSVEVLAGGSINVDSKGTDSDCPATGTFAFNGTSVVNLGSQPGAGGPHGGAVGNFAAFGIRDDPNEPGASGGGCGRRGGGLIRIKAKRVVNNGVLTANVMPTGSIAGAGGGGISIRVDPGETITGSGQFSARGGPGSGAAGASPGAGGRIALNGDSTTLRLNQFNVNGGTIMYNGNPNVFYGSPGTVFFSSKLADYTLVHSLWVGTGSNDSIIRSDANSNWSVPLGSAAGTRTTLTLTDLMPLTTSLGNMSVLGSLVLNGPVQLSSLTVGPTGRVMHPRLTSAYLSRRPAVDLTVSGAVTIDEGGIISTDAFGYPGALSATHASGCLGLVGARPAVADAGTGFTCEPVTGPRGGNHSVAGGANTTDFFWGDPTNPATYGGGGSRNNNSQSGDKAGAGGGVVRISAQSMVLNGSISARGENAVSNTPSGATGTGAGAGGSINLEIAGSLSSMNTGIISANGGSATAAMTEVHGGAGGLVRIVAGSRSGTIAVTSTGGAGLGGGLTGTSTTPIELLGAPDAGP